jgi:hypothetical protein
MDSVDLIYEAPVITARHLPHLYWIYNQLCIGDAPELNLPDIELRRYVVKSNSLNLKSTDMPRKHYLVTKYLVSKPLSSSKLGSINPICVHIRNLPIRQVGISLPLLTMVYQIRNDASDALCLCHGIKFQKVILNQSACSINSLFDQLNCDIIRWS